MDLYDEDLDRRAEEAGLIEVLALARALILDREQLQVGSEVRDTYETAVSPVMEKPLPKSEPSLLQQHNPYKKPYRQSAISSAMRSRIIQLSFNMRSCQQIADTIYKEFHQSISKSTVNRIINGKYKPKAIK